MAVFNLEGSLFLIPRLIIFYDEHLKILLSMMFFSSNWVNFVPLKTHWHTNFSYSHIL